MNGRILSIYLSLVVSCSASFMSGRCQQWCISNENASSGGVWIEKLKICRCFIDYELWQIDALKLPYNIQKSKNNDE